LAVDTELSVRAGTARRKHDARRDLNQGLKTAAIQWQVLGELTVHDRAYCAIGCIHERSTCRHRHAFRHRTNLETKVLLDVILDVYDEARDINYLEACGGYFDPVTPWPNARKHVESGGVGSRAGRGIPVDVDQLHFGTRNAQSGWVHDLPGDGRGFELREGRVRSKYDEQQ